MKKIWAKRWVKALRSKKYVQGTAGLTTGAGNTIRHCCLGVLQDIAAPEVPFWQYRGLLSEEALEVTGVRRNNGRLPHLDSSLSLMNDHGMTFEEIATVIENNWEDL